MSQTTAATKALRVSDRRRAINDRWRAQFRTLERKFKKALAGQAAQDTQTLFVQLQSTLDRMARRDILHRNTAARKKSRLAAQLRKHPNERPPAGR